MIVTSLLARAILSCVIKKIRYTSKSLQTLLILFTVCYIYTLNYVVLYIIAPFNISNKQEKYIDSHQFVPFAEMGISTGFFSWVAQGIYTDFNEYWFRDIGALVISSYSILVIFPPIEFAVLWLIRVLARSYDQRQLCCWSKQLPLKTRKKTISAYKNLYQGPEFDIEYQYAQIWILLSVAFIFGPAIPILFLLGFIGLLILDVTLRLRIAYSVRRFPIYDQKMNKSMIVAMRYLPVFFYIICAWLYSNQQLFQNNVIPNKSYYRIFSQSGHNLKQFFTQLTPGTIFAILLAFMLAAWLISVVFRALRNCCKCRYGHSKYWDFNKMVTTKSLCSFEQTLTNRQREQWLREEVGTLMRLGIRHLSESSIQSLLLSHIVEAESEMQACQTNPCPNKQAQKEQQRMVAHYNYDMLSCDVNANDL